MLYRQESSRAASQARMGHTDPPQLKPQDSNRVVTGGLWHDDTAEVLVPCLMPVGGRYMGSDIVLAHMAAKV